MHVNNHTSQSSNAPFKIASADGFIIFLPDNESKRLCMMPEDVASLDRALETYFSSKYTSLPANVPIFVKGIQIGFVRNLSLFVNPMMEETDLACRRLISGNIDWQSANLHYLTGQLAAQVSSRAFVGKSLCNDQRWLQMLLGYPGKQWAAIRAVQGYPKWSQGLLYRSLGAVKALRCEQQSMADLLKPHFLICLAGDDKEETITKYFLEAMHDREQCDVLYELLTLHLRLHFVALRKLTRC